jgi:LssY C-terminus
MATLRLGSFGGTAAALGFVFALTMLGCAATYAPKPIEPALLRHASVKDEKEVRVSIVVLTEAESREYFGRPLASHGIQAVWVRVENRNPYALWILPRQTDPDYYSPLEASFLNHFLLASATNQSMDDLFLRYRIARRVPAHGASEGFIFTNLNEGTKFVNIELWHNQGLIDVEFLMILRSGHFDYEQIDFHNLYRPEEIKSLDLPELRKTLVNMQCCATGEKGRNADPLNLVIIGTQDEIFSALSRQAWDPTHALGIEAARKTIAAFMLGQRYRYSPVSPLYLFGRQQDLAFQKARGTIHQRNHMRLWLSPYTCQGQPVWVGQISRDIGVRLTWQSPFLTTHKIDPEIDESRDYLVEDVLASESLQSLAYVKGVGAAPPQAPRHNLTGDPYFTDGMRAVMFLSAQPVAMDDVRYIRWQPFPND